MLNIVIPTLIIVWFTRSLNQRLVRILKHMKKVKNRFFETIKQPESKDEIGQLTAEFNRMTLQIKSLIQDVYQADIQKKELELKRNQAQLHALQSQINPHFLFNSLETIRMRSLMKEERETARIIHNMAKMFRRSLSWGNDRVTVRDELDLVVCFLEIQQYRFGGKLNYRIDVEPEAEQALIPKMTLQPLIENASIHGIEPLKGDGVIDVSVRLADGMLVCKVNDNGAGMSAERLRRLRQELEHSDGIGERIGIKNVYYRLKLYYGSDADFRIRSVQGDGTEIEIRLPASLI
ncbi:sensor histidine kinase [Paenibacillus tarimensis]